MGGIRDPSQSRSVCAVTVSHSVQQDKKEIPKGITKCGDDFLRDLVVPWRPRVGLSWVLISPAINFTCLMAHHGVDGHDEPSSFLRIVWSSFISSTSLFYECVKFHCNKAQLGTDGHECEYTSRCGVAVR